MSASTLNPSVADQIRQFPGCRCSKHADKSTRLLETLLRENAGLNIEFHDCGSGHASYDEITALCSKTSSGKLRLRVIRGAHKVPVIVSGYDYDVLVKALRTAANSHNIKVALN